MAPETGRRRIGNVVRLLASMRPGHDGPGNFRVAARVAGLALASMRPGHDGPGNDICPRAGD